MVNTAVLVSGGGTNLEAVLTAVENKTIRSARVALVAADRPGCYALKRAELHNVPHLCLDRRSLGKKCFEAALKKAVEEHECRLIVLAGFLSILSEDFVRAFEGRIINIHPSLIPSFCGDGFYGLKVHQAALERGVKITGATVHLVNEITDGGKILLQKAVEVKDGDSPESLQERVMREAEHIILPQAVEMMAAKLQKEEDV